MELHRIIKYFGGDCTFAEREEVEKWFNSSEENSRQFERLKKIWNNSRTVPDSLHPDFEKAWTNIANQTGIKAREAKMPPAVSPVRYLLRTAAAIIILVAIGTLVYTMFLNKPLVTKEYSQEVARKEVQLADGTVITLNRNSSIAFPEKFTSGNREVKLEGEAFFKVAKDPQHPFIVHANGTTIKVLGTSFNIKIRGNEMVKVSVLSGKVAFQSESQHDKLIQLEKGEQGVFLNTSQYINKQRYTDENFLAWETGIITFNNTSLADAVQVLSEYYGKPIEVNPELNGRSITVTFNNLPLAETLEILKMTLNIQSENLSGKVVLTPIRNN